MEEILGKFINILPPKFQWSATVAVIVFLLSLFIIKEFGINPSFFNTDKRLRKKILFIDSLKSVLDMPKDEKFLEKRKSYFQKKLETRQLQKQFQEYGRERLGENNPEVEKIFKPRKFFAFTFYSVLFFICTLLLAVVMSLFVHEDNLSYPIFTKNKMLNLFVCVIFFVGGIFLCVGLQQLWQRIQISFVFRTFLLPRIHVEGGYAINSEESAFAKMIEIRKINNPRFGFIAPLSGALFGCSIPFYILCANLLRIFPNNLILSILGFVLMLFWFYGLFYSIISFAIFLSCETNNKAY